MAREKGGGTGMSSRVREERGVGGKEKEEGRRGEMVAGWKREG